MGAPPFEKFVTPWHWIGFIILCVLFFATVFYMASRLNKYLEKRKQIIEAYHYVLSPLENVQENADVCEISNEDSDVKM